MHFVHLENGVDMVTKSEGALADMLEQVLSSPNEADRNGENANVVDGLFAIARAIERLSKAIEAQNDDE